MRVIVLVGLLGSQLNVYAQKRVLTAGFQFKPIFTANFLNTGPITLDQDTVSFSIKQKFGYCVGMVVRYGITNTVSFETGINYVKRNFDLSVASDTASEAGDFGIVGYEIPLKALVFIQLSEQIYMNGATGISLDFYPSDVFTSGDYYKHLGLRRRLSTPSLLANLGFEYRTKESGYIYLGASFHRPFKDIYTSYLQYEPTVQGPKAETLLSGNYLTVDLRYFFHDVPIERKNKTKKSKKGKKKDTEQE